MEKIIVSACLLGDKVRYDGKSNYQEKIELIKAKYDIIVICPEVDGGLKIPRIPSERRGAGVYDQTGKDVTNYFVSGANKALQICRYFNIKKALLKEKSPSCGKYKTYDGYFSYNLIDRPGLTAELLMREGVKIYNENEIDELLK